RRSTGAVPAATKTCPTISPAVRLRSNPSFAVMQNLQSTAHPTWLEIQIVARSQSCSSSSFESELLLLSSRAKSRDLLFVLGPSRLLSGIQTVSTVLPSASFKR